MNRQNDVVKTVIIWLVGVFIWNAVVVSIGCGSKSNDRHVTGVPDFNATIVEMDDNSIVVTPFEGEDELRSAERIMIGKGQMTEECKASIKAGSKIRVLYDEIQEVYPATIAHVYEIRLLNELGEAIED